MIFYNASNELYLSVFERILNLNTGFVRIVSKLKFSQYNV